MSTRFERENFKRIAVFVSLISITLLSATVKADWSIKGLGTLGGSFSSATAINDSGQIVGYYATTEHGFDGPVHAFITGPGGTGMTDLGTLGGDLSFDSIASDINDSGQVVGKSDIDIFGAQHPFITGPGGIGMTDLGTLGGPEGFAVGINNSGQVVGSFVVGDLDYRAFMTGPGGVGITVPGNLDGVRSNVSAINDSGQVVGWHDLGEPFITGPNGTGLIDLGNLPEGHFSSPTDINNSGQVVGVAYTASGHGHAFITGSNGIGMTDLGTFGGLTSDATAVNDLGEVIGTATANGIFGQPAFLYSHGGMTNLQLLDVVVTSGWSAINVRDINNNGQIVGYGTNSHGVDEAFLLSYTPDTVFTPSPIYIPTSPIPEPETYLMLLSGLSLIGFLAHRSQKIGYS